MTIVEKTKSKKVLHAIHDKYYAKDAKKQEKTAVAERASEIVKTKGPSRNDLMLKAKAAGIKNFRILNKEELFQVLDHPGDAISITEKAVTRWKAGWGNRKAKPGAFTSACQPPRV